jgi:hypothetical protein
MADNITPTEVRRARGLARYAHTCEVCGGHYDQTPNGRLCGTGCKIKPTPVAKGPYSMEEKQRAKYAPKTGDRGE